MAIGKLLAGLRDRTPKDFRSLGANEVSWQDVKSLRRGEWVLLLAVLYASYMSADFNVRYTAQLARLNLSDAEVETFQGQLAQVLTYVEKLKEVDVSGVEPTAHANAVHNVFREDASRPWFTPEVALSNAPRQANGLFIVPKVIE